jgi:hypothetical protein
MDDTQLDKYRHDLAFLRAAAAQTVKDCERMGFEISIDGDKITGILHLQLQLEPYLKQWCKESSSRLAALLYQIDLPEHLIPERGACSDIPYLSSIIIKRELIKVVMRKLYTP